MNNWVIYIFAIGAIGIVLYKIFEYALNRKMSNFAKQVMLSDLRAIRAQMNPHFIFNSLNSINRYILKNEPDIASDYLGRFAKLMRLVLDNSNHERITLKDELETMQLYIELEQLRFEHNFSYHTLVDPQINPEKILVQPLIFQPFLENAIWHGLMHKEDGDRLLTLAIKISGQNLCCEISDNGVGRNKHKKDSESQKKSYGINLVRDRLKFLDRNASVEIIDIKDQRGLACGTKVILHFKAVEEFSL
jgi:LytS/YehU family sensor histidine kinase